MGTAVLSLKLGTVMALQFVCGASRVVADHMIFPLPLLSVAIVTVGPLGFH